MSAHKTNIETQVRRHRPSLWGMGLVVAAVAVLLTGFLYTVMTDDTDEVDAIITLPQEESQ